MKNFKKLSPEDMSNLNGGIVVAVPLLPAFLGALAGKLGNDMYNDPSGSVDSFMEGYHSTRK